MNVPAFIREAALLLAAVDLWGAAPCFTGAEARATEPVAVGTARLERIYHAQLLLPDREHAGFGSLLYDEKGELALHDGTKTWLYTTGLSEAASGGQRNWYGKWISYVREFDVKSLAAGEPKIALGLSDADRWAVIHDVMRVSSSLFVAFYSANGSVRAATSERPDGLFKAVPGFKIEVTDAWERQGGKISSLESNGAHVVIGQTEHELTEWIGYDSYHVDQTAGRLGWAKVRIDKTSGNVQFVGKNPLNPLPVLPANYIAARCGGNLATNVRLGDKYALFYYTRRSKQRIMLTAALSSDPLFRHISDIVEIEPPLADEVVIEKFETYLFDGKLHIIYENRLDSGDWGTGIRVYNIVD